MLNENDADVVAEREKADSAQDDELDELYEDIAEEILNELGEIGDPLSSLSRLARDIQPPTSVICLAAQAAAAVFISFERGYRMSVEAANGGSHE